MPLMELKTIDSCWEMLDKYCSCFFRIMLKHHYDSVETQSQADTRTLFQMMFSKALNVKLLLNGIEYDDGESHLKNIIDPTILYTVIRNMYEALCAFELINIIPNTDEKRIIIYHLFKISGLKYRQRFFDVENLTPEQKKKGEIEKQEIDKSINIIKNTSLYLSLSQSDKCKIEKVIKDKTYQIVIDDDNKVKLLGWKDIPRTFGAVDMNLGFLYTNFCLNAHPSYVSMFQFRDMFSKDNPEYISMTIDCIRICLTILGIYLADYITLFPQVLETYKTFSMEDQFLLDFHNYLARGEKFSIGDSWKLLED